ncbi:uncharacterized protein LOC144348183 [Saccoglossus kowalevskii]
MARVWLFHLILVWQVYSTISMVHQTDNTQLDVETRGGLKSTECWRLLCGVCLENADEVCCWTVYNGIGASGLCPGTQKCCYNPEWVNKCNGNKRSAPEILDMKRDTSNADQCPKCVGFGDPHIIPSMEQYLILMEIYLSRIQYLRAKMVLIMNSKLTSHLG